MEDRASADLPPLAWLDGSGPESDVVLSTRVRLARNLRGQRFRVRASHEDREAVLRDVRGAAAAVPALRGGFAYRMASLGATDRRLLREAQLASKELVGDGGDASPPHSALLLGPGADIGVMVNEEDHLRLQVLLSGLRLDEAWRRADEMDEQFGARLPYAYHEEFGYLTSCPTNVGTGLRASALIHLPGLVLTQEITKVLHGLAHLGLTYRGLAGEGSEIVGNLFQISNQTTLGKTEGELLSHLGETVGRIIDQERQARRVLLDDARPVLADKVWRAYGLLRHAHQIGVEELLNLLSGVRLGVWLKLLPSVRVQTLNALTIGCGHAHLERLAGATLSEADAQVHRARQVRQAFARDVPPPREGQDSPV